jgi:hypothetical protein
MNEVSDEDNQRITNEDNVVSGIVIDSNNPVFRTSSDQFINADSPVEASDVVTVGDDQYFVPDVRIYRDAITIQNKRNTIIVLACFDISINFVKVLEGYSLYIFYMLCACYGYMGAKDFNYRYMSIYTYYLFLAVLSNFLLCINYYYNVKDYKYEINSISNNTTSQQENTIRINNYFNIISLMVQGYIYYYANDFKRALKNYHHGNEATVISIQ